MSIRNAVTLNRIAFASTVGFLQALAFLRWEWLPETPEGRTVAFAVGVLLWFALSFLYIPRVRNND